MITPDRLRELLNYDPVTGVFTWIVARGSHKPGAVAGRKHGYVNIMIDGRMYKAHRLAWLYVTGEWPEADIDHVNMNKRDNRFYNLREATRSQNRMHTGAHADSKSGAKGVSWYKRGRKWRAAIHVGGKQRHLGYFATKAEAMLAYSAAARSIFGEFAGLILPPKTAAA